MTQVLQMFSESRCSVPGKRPVVKAQLFYQGGRWHSGLYIPHRGEISHLTFSLCHSLICLYFSHTCAPFLTFSLSFTHTHTHVPEKYRRLVSVDAWQHSMVSLSAVKSQIRTLKSMQFMLLISETFIVYIYISSLQKPKKDRNHTSACTHNVLHLCVPHHYSITFTHLKRTRSVCVAASSVIHLLVSISAHGAG